MATMYLYSLELESQNLPSPAVNLKVSETMIFCFMQVTDNKVIALSDS